ncbi:MAG: hypothetical protein IJ132_06090, partial [Firmicutes bacterium]|nr:hypothetical protein [Bacillota bacterium]
MFGLLGEKLGHSYSKLIHEKLGYSYDLIERAPEELAAFLLDGEFDGLNVTIPYKKTVMEYCHQVSDLAKRIGAVNTIYKEGSRLMGTNTDYEGLRYALGRANISLAGKKVLILGGTGGAGSMASILAADKGAGEILIATRGDKAFHGDRLFVSHSPGQSAKQKACPRETVSYDELPGDVETIINATPVGTYPEVYKSPVELAGFECLEGVVDLIYNPLRTELLMQA